MLEVNKEEEKEWVTRVGDVDEEMTERSSSPEASLIRRVNLVRGWVLRVQGVGCRLQGVGCRA